MKQELLKGVRDVAPLLIGVIPFGVSSGLYAVEQGFTAFEAMFMSFVIFAGASQVATVGLMINEAPFWIIVATAILINLRFLIYSASVSPFVPLVLCVVIINPLVLSHQSFIRISALLHL